MPFVSVASSPRRAIGDVGETMAKRRKNIRHAAIVQRFADRLRETRRSRGLTQAELAEKAHVTVSYIWRLESGGAAPGIDLVDRLATALGTTVADLLPTTAPADPLAVLREQAKTIFNGLLQTADRETYLMLNPLLARLAEAPSRSR
jgi:transcriptional regulator with XRE-family HTH domain